MSGHLVVEVYVQLMYMAPWETPVCVSVRTGGSLWWRRWSGQIVRVERAHLQQGSTRDLEVIELLEDLVGILHRENMVDRWLHLMTSQSAWESRL